MKVGIIGTGAIAGMHARAYRNIGYTVRACSNVTQEKGRAFAEKHGADFVPRWEDLCARSDIDFVDVCTFPSFRLDVVRACAANKKAVQVQKPMAISVEMARQMIEAARQGGIVLGVVSQHRFDRASQFLFTAIQAGRLGRLLQCDAYVKWWRSDEYYSRPVKGSWSVEGGGALINQAIHQVDLLLWFAGRVRSVYGTWQLGAAHAIESEDLVNALLRYESGAQGVIQAATALWPGYSERIEMHGTKGTAIITGDQLTTWDVREETGDPPPLSTGVSSGASDPMAIAVDSFERQFLDFGEAVARGTKPLVAGEDGFEALSLVDAIYRSCRTGSVINMI